MRNADSAEVEVIFSIGSNCGDRLQNVKDGIEWLSHILTQFRVSPIYATPDCNGSQREYLNAVASGKTCLTPEAIDRLSKEYETNCGRDAAARACNNVPIDIDLVVYSSELLRPRDFAREFFQIGFRQISDNIDNQ